LGLIVLLDTSEATLLIEILDLKSIHETYGELLVLAGIREYSHSIKEAAGNPKKKKNPRTTNNKMEMKC
jgi:hypothetical protein